MGASFDGGLMREHLGLEVEAQVVKTEKKYYDPGL